MIERAARREPLFHPLDNRVWEARAPQSRAPEPTAPSEAISSGDDWDTEEAFSELHAAEEVEAPHSASLL
jgi:hypothetical protein